MPWTPLGACASGARFAVNRSTFFLDPLLCPDHVFDRAIVIFDQVWRTSTMFALPFLVSEEYRNTHYKLKDYLEL